MNKEIHWKDHPTSEWMTRVTMDRALLNLMTSVMPSMEGLFLVTVIDGRKGEAVIRYSPSVRSDMEQLFHYLTKRHGNGFRVLEDPGGWKTTETPPPI